MAGRHIEPGSPWQNGLDDRFNGSVRDEYLNMETFSSGDQARAIIKRYGQHYNDHRPHSGLRYQTPSEFARKCASTDSDPHEAREYADGCVAPLRKTPPHKMAVVF